MQKGQSLLLNYAAQIREIPDHATFRGKGVNTSLGYVSLWPYVIWQILAICNVQSIASDT